MQDSFITFCRSFQLKYIHGFFFWKNAISFPYPQEPCGWSLFTNNKEDQRDKLAKQILLPENLKWKEKIIFTGKKWKEIKKI